MNKHDQLEMMKINEDFKLYKINNDNLIFRILGLTENHFKVLKIYSKTMIRSKYQEENMI
jgi:hypothetical protein